MKLSRLSRTILFFACMIFGSLYVGINAAVSREPTTSLLCSLGTYVIGPIVYWITDEKHYTMDKGQK